MPKNPVRAARQAGREAVRAAKDTRKVAKIETKVANKVAKISGTPVAKKATTYKPSAPTVKGPAAVAKPKINTTADMRGKMKDMPAETRKAAPVKKAAPKATPKPTPRAVPAPPSPTPPKPTPAPKPEANMGIGSVYKFITGKEQPEATPKQKLQMEARSANKKATADYNAANAEYRKAFNEAKSASSYDSQAEKDRKKAAVNSAYDKMRKAKEANTKTFLDEKSAYNRKNGGAVKKYQMGGKVDPYTTKPTATASMYKRSGSTLTKNADGTYSKGAIKKKGGTVKKSMYTKRK